METAGPAGPAPRNDLPAAGTPPPPSWLFSSLWQRRGWPGAGLGDHLKDEASSSHPRVQSSRRTAAFPQPSPGRCRSGKWPPHLCWAAEPSSHASWAALGGAPGSAPCVLPLRRAARGLLRGHLAGNGHPQRRPALCCERRQCQDLAALLPRGGGGPHPNVQHIPHPGGQWPDAPGAGWGSPAPVRAPGAVLALEKGLALRGLCPYPAPQGRAWPVRIRVSYIRSRRGASGRWAGHRILLARHHAPRGLSLALGGGQARPINRGLPGLWPVLLASPARPMLLAPGSDAAQPGRMAAPRALWLALVLLGALGVLQTPAQAQASVQPNFEQDKFLGRWFTAGLASNTSWFREKKAALSMCSAVVAPAPPGDGDGVLNLTTTFLRKDRCETRSLLLRPAGPPGCYSYTSLHWGSSQDVWVEETDYGEYALLYAVGSGDHGFHMATLYSRTQTPRAAVKEKFTTFARAKGFTEEDIVFLPKTDKCLEEQQ